MSMHAHIKVTDADTGALVWQHMVTGEDSLGPVTVDTVHSIMVGWALAQGHQVVGAVFDGEIPEHRSDSPIAAEYEIGGWDDSLTYVATVEYLW